jgi:hypothetical protein
MLRDLAEFAVHFSDHPDVAELHRRAQELLKTEGDTPTDLVTLAAQFPPDRPLGDDDPGRPLRIAELRRSAREVIAAQDRMPDASRRLVGTYLLTLGSALVATLPWAWSFATALADPAGPATVRAHFLGVGFNPTPAFSLLLIVILSAMAGSVAVMALVFSARAGKHTLEQGWQWWYVTRPITAAIIGVLSYMALLTGFFDLGVGSDRPELVVAAAVGGLAGLFTDQILDKMRKTLAVTDPDKPARTH